MVTLTRETGSVRDQTREPFDRRLFAPSPFDLFDLLDLFNPSGLFPRGQDGPAPLSRPGPRQGVAPPAGSAAPVSGPATGGAR
ncbi:hypothetical protein ACQPZZ_25115 [Microbispora sp. CA-135349]|uniref:hypothetical protein n=1 Tax=Microbispora sp. CA-135349 TaxID=3239953 RepID=UPI003D8D15BA